MATERLVGAHYVADRHLLAGSLQLFICEESVL